MENTNEINDGANVVPSMTGNTGETEAWLPETQLYWRGEGLAQEFNAKASNRRTALPGELTEECRGLVTVPVA